MQQNNQSELADGQAFESRVSRRRFLSAGAALATAPVAAAAFSDSATAAPPSREVDLVVVGSGAAGTAAAITAAAEGAKVVLLEKAPIVGGTSAKSGGGVWIPNNAWLRSNGIEDLRAPFLAYCAQYSYPHLFDPDHATLGLEQNSYNLLAAFYDNAAPMLEWMTSIGAVNFGKAPGMPEFVDYGIVDGWNHVPAGRGLFPLRDDGSVGFGAELMRRLIAKARALNVEILTDHEAARLVVAADGAVTGLEARHGDQVVSLRARRGVVFGSGGFTYNRDLLNLHMKEPIYGGCGVPTNTGDFVRIAGAIGGQLGNMAGAWRSQIVLEEALQYVTVPSPMWIPPGDSMIMVNRYGRRFVNEKRNYHDRARAQLSFDANVPEFPNQLAFVIYDQRTAEMFAGGHPLPDDPTGSDYVIRADSWPSLAAAIGQRLKGLAGSTGGVSLETLAHTVGRFNGFARAGKDEDFRRGSFRYDIETAMSYSPRRTIDRWEVSGINPTIYPLADKGPYYAIIVAPGTLDTNGGPVIDKHARVLRHDGTPIVGLYGAGNCIASPAHDSYYAAGITLGMGMTFGHIAARHALGKA